MNDTFHTWYELYGTYCIRYELDGTYNVHGMNYTVHTVYGMNYTVRTVYSMNYAVRTLSYELCGTYNVPYRSKRYTALLYSEDDIYPCGSFF